MKVVTAIIHVSPNSIFVSFCADIEIFINLHAHSPEDVASLLRRI